MITRDRNSSILKLTASVTVAVTAGLLALPAGAHSEQGQTATGRSAPPLITEPGYSWEELATGLGRIQIAAGSGTNGFDTNLYVAAHDQSALLRIEPSGVMTEFAELGWMFPDDDTSSPAFDVFGDYAGVLVLNDVPDQEQVEVSSDGTGSVSDIADQLEANAIAMAFDPTDAFGGKLFVSDSDGHLHVIEPDGSTWLFATSVGDGCLRFVETDADGAALLIADRTGRRILRLTPDHVPGDIAPTWIDFNAWDVPVEPSGLVMSGDDGFGSDMLFVADASLGRIVGVTPEGDFDSDFVTGLGPGITSIELPAHGAFEDTMIIANRGRIWTVRPASGGSSDDDSTPLGLRDLRNVIGALGSPAGSPADLTGDGRVDLADVVAVLEAGGMFQH